MAVLKKSLFGRLFPVFWGTKYLFGAKKIFKRM